jgi:PleD family two-component response regulator
MDAAAEFAERIRAEIARVEVPHGSVQERTTASFGVGQRGAGQDLDTLIHCVDKALYAAKVAGRDRVTRIRELDACRELVAASAAVGG